MNKQQVKSLTFHVSHQRSGSRVLTGPSMIINNATIISGDDKIVGSIASIEEAEKTIKCPSLNLAPKREMNLDQIKNYIQTGRALRQDCEGNTLLHLVFQQFERNVSLAIVLSVNLLDRGVDPNQLNNNNWTPLHLALLNNQNQAVIFALKYNRKKGQKIPFNFSIQGGYLNLSLIHIAANRFFASNSDIYFKSQVSLFESSKKGQITRMVADQNLVLIKLLRKYEKIEIHKLCNNQSQLDQSTIFDSSTSFYLQTCSLNSEDGYLPIPSESNNKKSNKSRIGIIPPINQFPPNSQPGICFMALLYHAHRTKKFDLSRQTLTEILECTGLTVDQLVNQNECEKSYSYKENQIFEKWSYSAINFLNTECSKIRGGLLKYREQNSDDISQTKKSILERCDQWQFHQHLNEIQAKLNLLEQIIQLSKTPHFSFPFQSSRLNLLNCELAQRCRPQNNIRSPTKYFHSNRYHLDFNVRKESMSLIFSSMQPNSSRKTSTTLLSQNH